MSKANKIKYIDYLKHNSKAMNAPYNRDDDIQGVINAAQDICGYASTGFILTQIEYNG